MSDTEDDEVLRKITALVDSFDQKTTRLLEAELQDMKQERKAVAQEVEGPSPPRLPEPPTPPRLYGDRAPSPAPATPTSGAFDHASFDSVPSYAEVNPPDYGRTLHHLSGTPVTPIGDYLKDVRVVPVEVVPELGEDTLVAVPRQTVAIMHSLGLEYKYFTDSQRMKRMAGVAPSPADYIKRERKRRIGSE